MENKKQFMADRSNVKVLGRHTYDSGLLWLTSSGAAAEFVVNAKELSIVLNGDGSAHKDSQGNVPWNCVRFSIFVDGNLQQKIIMDEEEKTVEVFSGDQERSATVSVVKITEASQSYIAIKSIITDSNGKIAPSPEKKLRIEFIGDSITCGYGIDCKSTEEPFKTLTEDATETFAYLAARHFDADCALTSYSSFGVRSGWTDSGDLNDFSLLPKVYEKVTFSWNTQQFGDRAWDFSLYQPNLIVMNLGTNDISYCKTPEKCEEFVESYVSFIKRVRELNPDAFFILGIGIMKMGDIMWPYVEKAASLYTSITGDQRISTVHFTTQKPEEGLGSGDHPNAITQKRCSLEMISAIEKVLSKIKM